VSTPSKAKTKGRPAKAATPADPDLKKSDNTRARVLDATAYVMSQEGYAGTKLTDIARHAKLRVSTLYYYYPSREELVLAVLIAGTAQVRQHTEAALSALPARSTPMDRVCCAVESHLRHILEISHYTEATVRNTGQLPEHMRSQVAAEQAHYGRFWQKLIDDAVGANVAISASERRVLRMLIIGALNSTVEWWTPARASIDEVVQTALTMTRRTLGARPGVRASRP
jgi:AcrR family transcriptional regulator